MRRSASGRVEADRPGVADLAVQEPPVDADAALLAEARVHARRAVALPPVVVGARAVEGDVAVARGRAERARARGHERRALPLALVSGLPRRPAGNAVGARPREDLHDAADGVRAVERREGPARDLDAVDVLRRQPRPVVAGEVRRVHPHAVDEHERLRRVGAAREERSQRARRAVLRQVEAGHRAQHVRDDGGLVLLELLARDDGDRRADVFLVFRRRGRRDDDLLGGRRNLLGVRSGRHAEEGERQRRRSGRPQALPARERVETEERRRADEVRRERRPEERNRRRIAEGEAGRRLRVDRIDRPLGEVGGREEERRRADGEGREHGRVRLPVERAPGEHDRGEGPVDRDAHDGDGGAPRAEVEEDVGDGHGRQRHGPGPAARQTRAGVERERAEGDEVGRMGKEPGQGAEENQQDRGRHSNLPFDRTDLSNGREASRAPGIRRRVLSCGPVREACRPAGLLASGSSAFGLLPGRATGSCRSLASSGLPPEASPVTVAGAAWESHPLPLAERFKEREGDEP